ncbi:metal-dependent transcriptional regulator [Ruminococcus sp.]|jgi:Mn-dependent DtxR family transcriptional regulator|uniref:metal-dependent transcriptional regulator n=1 Tax=Ruminococcus sp. TaxID=41978 RepID=UPI0025DE8054|nr:metal-dependent transcriptional regulator [Ruminococcus sp.]
MLGKEKTENYLRTILKIQETCGSARGIDIVGELGVSKPTVSIAVHELEKEGYIECTNSYNIILTRKGIELAKKIKGRYCFFLLMLRYMGVGEENAKIDACKMEHSMGDESYKALLDFFLHNHPEIVSQENSGFKELFFDM